MCDYHFNQYAKDFCEQIAKYNAEKHLRETCYCGNPITLEMERDLGKCAECQRFEAERSQL